MLKKKLYKILIERFWEKSGVEGGLVALQFFFGHLKRALVPFITVRMSPL